MAEAQRYATGAEPQIILHHINGDLSIDGWMNEEVAVRHSQCSRRQPDRQRGRTRNTLQR